MTNRSNPPYRVFLGFTADEMRATAVAEWSLRQTATADYTRVNVRRLCRLSLGACYRRPTTVRDGRLWDVLSDAPMSTDHAIARFFIPYLCEYQGWALFTDGDVLFRRSVGELFAQAQDQFAVMCVQHPPLTETGAKKLGDPQTTYGRKNWSSVVLFNCGHPSNRQLDLPTVNTLTGRALHAFSWLPDREIGWLGPEWNYLVGVNPPVADPAIVHFTLGDPTMPGHAQDPFADEWFVAAQAAGFRGLR